jgi:hypothetical protein
MLKFRCLVKRSRALRGRNPTRNSRVKGAPKVHRAFGRVFLSEAVFFLLPLDTFAMPPKIRRRKAPLAFAWSNRWPSRTW